MANETTSAFTRMMLSGRVNEIMAEGAKEGIAATKAARLAQEKGRKVNPKLAPLARTATGGQSLQKKKVGGA